MSPTKTGSYVGTGGALNISLGWTPDHIIIENTTDGNARWEWFFGMAAGTALQTTSLGDKTTLATNGITPFVGTAAALPKGFTVGTALSTNTKTFRYTAHRSVD